jgi:hypothetical protein
MWAALASLLLVCTVLPVSRPAAAQAVPVYDPVNHALERAHRARQTALTRALERRVALALRHLARGERMGPVDLPMDALQEAAARGESYAFGEEDVLAVLGRHFPIPDGDNLRAVEVRLRALQRVQAQVEQLERQIQTAENQLRVLLAQGAASAVHAARLQRLRQRLAGSGAQATYDLLHQALQVDIGEGALARQMLGGDLALLTAGGSSAAWERIRRVHAVREGLGLNGSPIAPGSTPRER